MADLQTFTNLLTSADLPTFADLSGDLSTHGDLSTPPLDPAGSLIQYSLPTHGGCLTLLTPIFQGSLLTRMSDVKRVQIEDLVKKYPFLNDLSRANEEAFVYRYGEKIYIRIPFEDSEEGIIEKYICVSELSKSGVDTDDESNSTEDVDSLKPKPKRGKLTIWDTL